MGRCNVTLSGNPANLWLKSPVREIRTLGSVGVGLPEEGNPSTRSWPRKRSAHSINTKNSLYNRVCPKSPPSVHTVAFSGRAMMAASSTGRPQRGLAAGEGLASGIMGAVMHETLSTID